MDFEIKELVPLQLYGMALNMSLLNNKTPELWKNFRQTCALQQYALPDNMISLQVYNQANDYMKPSAEFTKWAGFAATPTQELPVFLQALTIPAGTYAVFNFDGGPSRAVAFFTEVFSQTLPNAGCTVDFRPHFEVLDKNYHENLKEEIWIPIQSV